MFIYNRGSQTFASWAPPKLVRGSRGHTHSILCLWLGMLYAVYIYHLLFPLPFCHTTPPLFHLYPAGLKGPPLLYVLKVLLKVSSRLTGSFFIGPVAIVFALSGVQALGSVKCVCVCVCEYVCLL